MHYFLPCYFDLIWSPDDSQQSKDMKSAYAITNALVIMIFGTASTMIGGYVSDVYEEKGYLMTKAYVCIISGLVGTVFFSLCTLVQIGTPGGFAFSMTMLALENLSSENFVAPSMNMVVRIIKP